MNCLHYAVNLVDFSKLPTFGGLFCSACFCCVDFNAVLLAISSYLFRIDTSPFIAWVFYRY